MLKVMSFMVDASVVDQRHDPRPAGGALLDLHRERDHGEAGRRQRLEIGQALDLQIFAVASDHVRGPQRVRNALLVIRRHVARRAVEAPGVDADHANALIEQVVAAVGMQAGLQIGKLRIVEMLVGVGAQQHDLARRQLVTDLLQAPRRCRRG